MITDDELTTYITDSVESYHDKILVKLKDLKLKSVLKRKNPYLFKIKEINNPADLIKSILDAHLSSQEEGVFGWFLEELAIFVCEMTYGGAKSATEGIDLDFVRDSTRYLVSIKSGPNWGNANSIKKLREHFQKAKKILGANSGSQNVVALNGCCYGKEGNPDKGDYVKLCGQAFWEKISGDNTFYKRIIGPLSSATTSKSDAFKAEYDIVLDKFIAEFVAEFCDEDDNIDWNKLLVFNSGG